MVVVKILLSVGSIISHKKDCRKMCDHCKKKFKSQVGRVLVAVKILLSVGSIISHKKRLPQNV